LGWSKAVHAEGSADLIKNGGDRPYLDYREGSPISPGFGLGGIPRRSTIKVYANPGETINLGSSATGRGGTINYRSPDGTDGTCGAGVGQILTVAAEVAGSGAGYIPCTITVGANQTGVWEIDFVSPDPTSGADPTPIPANTDWAPQPPNVGYVAAWDVTVRNAGGAAIPGRVYANYLALNMGSNGVTLNSNTFIQTDIGYLYQIDLKGLDPFGFIFFSNSKGFTDLPCPGGTPLYTSIPLTPAPFFCIPANADNPATGDITIKSSSIRLVRPFLHLHPWLGVALPGYATRRHRRPMPLTLALAFKVYKVRLIKRVLRSAATFCLILPALDTMRLSLMSIGMMC
jgi:hypothetical protein